VDAIRATLGDALILPASLHLRADDPDHADVRAGCTLEEERGR
jgi:hypothetical protein